MAADISAAQSPGTLQTLNELLGVLCSSLPAYLAEARPWMQSEDKRAGVAMDHLTSDQQRYARRVSDAVVALGGRPDPGRFPTNFTAKNDLALDFLRQEVVRQLERDVATVRRLAAQLADYAPLHSLAEEILGNLKGHLDVLREIGGS